MSAPTSFDLGRPFVARKSFVASGVAYAAGDVFPWREVASEHALRTLWRAMLVRNVEPVEPKRKKSKASETPQTRPGA